MPAHTPPPRYVATPVDNARRNAADVRRLLL
jgi:hypothetical protein